MTAVTSNVRCASCGAQLPSEQINVATDTAHCLGCGTVGKLSELLVTKRNAESFVGEPPAGVSFQQDGEGFEIVSTIRSLLLVFMLPFAVAWISFLSFFISQMPADGPVQMKLFMLPFVVAGIALLTTCVLMALGRVSVGAKGYEGWVFIGVGSLGWTRRFSWRDIERIEEGRTSFQVNGTNQPTILLSGSRYINFGSMLSGERRNYILRRLQTLRAKMR